MTEPTINQASGFGREVSATELFDQLKQSEAERHHWRRRYEAAYELWLRATVDQELVRRAAGMAASLVKARALAEDIEPMNGGTQWDLAQEFLAVLDAPTEPAPELVRAPDAPTQVATSTNPSEEQQ